MDALTKENLKVAVAQFPILFPRKAEDILENMVRVERVVQTITSQEKGIDLILFCEECIDNLPMNLIPSIMTDDMLRQVEEFWRRMARVAGTHLAAGHMGKQDGKWRNYATCFTPEGEILARYAKSHLYFSERSFFEPGDDPAVFDFKGWKTSFIICADFGFPEFSRIQAARGCELFLAPSSWIYPHDQLWILSNRMRAAENMAYLVSANHLGTLPEGPRKLGHSMAVNPAGEVIANLGLQQDAYFTVNLCKEQVRRNREELPWLQWTRPELYKQLY